MQDIIPKQCFYSFIGNDHKTLFNGIIDHQRYSMVEVINKKLAWIKKQTEGCTIAFMSKNEQMIQLSWNQTF